MDYKEDLSYSLLRFHLQAIMYSSDSKVTRHFSCFYKQHYNFVNCGTPESIDLFIEDQAFLWPYDSAPHPPPTHLSSQQVVYLSQYSCVSPTEFTDGRGGWEVVGGKPNQTMARKTVLL